MFIFAVFSLTSYVQSCIDFVGLTPKLLHHKVDKDLRLREQVLLVCIYKTTICL